MFGFFPSTEALLAELEEKVPDPRTPEEKLRCPMDGCGRPNPVEESGQLRCWWCGWTGARSEFPPK